MWITKEGTTKIYRKGEIFIDVFNLGEIVRMYGNEKQKQMIIDMSGNLKADSFKSLLKTVKQHYEFVEFEGRGRGRTFNCYNKLTKSVSAIVFAHPEARYFNVER